MIFLSPFVYPLSEPTICALVFPLFPLFVWAILLKSPAIISCNFYFSNASFLYLMSRNEEMSQ